MADRRYRVLAISSHPIQYGAPLFRRLAQHPQLEFSVAYCSMRGAQPGHDPDFNITVQWDVPLLDGYSWKEIPNRGSSSGSPRSLFNPGLWNLIRRGKYDAVVCYISYLSASFWISFFAARLSGAAFLFGTDSSSIVPRTGAAWKVSLKRILWPVLFSLADQVLVPSSAGRNLILSVGIPEDRITLTPYSVDNEWWMTQSQKVDRNAVRTIWEANPETFVVLFCAKLQTWKRPLDLLRAFARANLPDALLVYAGDGLLRPQLATEASILAVSPRVRFLGFQNQSQLPAVYTASDLLVLPSEYEPFAVVVNEASCCGCPVAASDRVGAARDLIAPVDPRLVYACGDVGALATLLVDLYGDRARLRYLGLAAKKRMTTWSTSNTVEGTVKAVEVATHRRGR